jgi:hypothetical protein
VLTPTSAKIGPAGETLNSSEGKLSISIPAGAVTRETEIAIQPAQDESGESFGPVYQLSPEGTTFPQPVTLAWHLSDSDLSTTNLDNLIVRTKPASGVWHPQPDVQRDETAHTISVAANHFSQWGLAMTLRIEPAQAKVFAGDSVKIDAFVGETTLRPQPPTRVARTSPPPPLPLQATISSRAPSGASIVLLGGNSSVGVVDAPIIGFYRYEDAAHQPATIWRQTACPVKIQ